jgi:endonuclease/exonuclease/phosphatase family metal-dependent hydrolase
MKIFLIVLLLCVSSFAQIKVASWNLKNVSLNSLMFKKSISKINDYIESKSDFDVICLQELRDDKIIYFLSGGIKQIIFSPFDRITSKYKGEGTHKEVYGFLVNKKYKDIKKIEFNNYRKFKRPPTAVILDRKIAVVNVHIVYGKTVKARKSETKALNDIIKELERKYKIPKTNIIIAGDFNLTYKNMKKIHNNKTIWVNNKTTVGTKGFSKDYDHFITFTTKGKANARQDIVKDLKFFRKNISDHIPIELVIN